IILAPGEAFSYDQLLIWDGFSKAPIFRSPGTWRLMGVLHGFGRLYDVYSLPVEILVEEPTGPDEHPSDLFGSPAVIDVMMNFGEDPGAVAELQRLIDEHTDSRFSDYARFYLAHRMMEGFFDRKPDYDA